MSLMFSVVMYFVVGMLALAPSALASPWILCGVADFNGDRKDDLLWRRADGDSSVWYVDGGHILAAPPIPPLPPDWTVHGIGDFDGNGRADILWRRSSGECGIWLFKENQVQNPTMPEIARLGIDWQVGGIADFDNDGKSDILWRRATSGENSIWFMDGVMARETPGIEHLPTDWRIDGVSDVAGNGAAAILFRRSSAAFGIWLVSGTKAEKPLMTNSDTLSHDWQAVSLRDFDKDGFVDILWTNRITRERSVWFMRGGDKVADVELPKMAEGDSLEGIGDLNGDGATDFVLLDSGGGFTAALGNPELPSRAVGAIGANRYQFALADHFPNPGPGIVPINGIKTTDASWGRAVHGAVECSSHGCSAILLGGYDMMQFPDEATAPAPPGWQKKKIAAGQNTRLEFGINSSSSAVFLHPSGADACDEYFLIGDSTTVRLDGVTRKAINFGGAYWDLAITVPRSSTVYYQYPAGPVTIPHSVSIEFPAPPAGLRSAKSDTIDSGQSPTAGRNDGASPMGAERVKSNEKEVRDNDVGLISDWASPHEIVVLEVWNLLHGASSKAASIGQGVFGRLFTKAPTTTRGYRVVSEAEYQEILRSGQIVQGEGALEAKWFWESPEHAAEFAQKMKLKEYRVIEADLPNNAKTLHVNPRQDSIGPARSIGPQELQDVVPRLYEPTLP